MNDERPAESVVTGLVARARDGDRAAFAELFRLYRCDVTRVLHRMANRSDLDDLVQEVFLQVYKSLPDFRGQAKFSTWLHRVTVNVVLMSRRAAKARPILAGEPAYDRERDPRPLPDEEAAVRARLEAFRFLVGSLSEKKRVVFVLHDLEGVPPSEIATIVGAPVLTVRTRLFYARRELEAMMREDPTLATFCRELDRAEANSSSGRPPRDSGPARARPADVSRAASLGARSRKEAP